MKSLKSLLARIHQDETGAMAVEKILLLAVIAIPVILVLYKFALWAIDHFNQQADQLKQ